MASAKKKPGVKLEDLYFYFDSVERDSLDAAGISRRSSEVLALRERLLRMPEEEFDAAIKTMRSLCTDAPRGDGEGREARGQKARQLYEQTRARPSGGSGGKTSKVSAT
jgi:hypothetical protein